MTSIINRIQDADRARAALKDAARAHPLPPPTSASGRKRLHLEERPQPVLAALYGLKIAERAAAVQIAAECDAAQHYATAIIFADPQTGEQIDTEIVDYWRAIQDQKEAAAMVKVFILNRARAVTPPAFA